MFECTISGRFDGVDLQSTLSSAITPLPKPAGPIHGKPALLHSSQEVIAKEVAGNGADPVSNVDPCDLNGDDLVARIVSPLLECKNFKLFWRHECSCVSEGSSHYLNECVIRISGCRANSGTEERLTVPFDVTNAKQLALEVGSCKRVISHLQSIKSKLQDMLEKVEAEKEWVRGALGNDAACILGRIESAVGCVDRRELDI